jgi:hypothetical protein
LINNIDWELKKLEKEVKTANLEPWVSDGTAIKSLIAV